MKISNHKIFCGLASVLSLSVLLTGCFETRVVHQQGRVLNIASWNDEYKDRFETYCKDLVPENVTVKWHIFGDTDYQGQIDEYLAKQDSLPEDERLDLFLVEADYALKYVNSDYTLDVIKDIGIYAKDLDKQYKYTKDIMTDKNGCIKGLSWQACPGGFFYRRSIASMVFGTDDPKKVQQHLSDWDKFDKTAALMHEFGYYMLSGYDDSYRVFWDNTTVPCVKNGKIQIDSMMQRWINQTKLYTENEFNNKANLWSAESWNGAKKTGKVFGYFGPAWFIDYCLAPATLDNPNKPRELGNGSYGDWAFCNGPQGFSWGGSWMCAVKGSDNIPVIHDVMYKLTCEETTAVRLATEKNDFTNNEKAMMKIASSVYTNPFLGGQNHMSGFVENAKKINKDNMTIYDRDYAVAIQSAYSRYFSGEVTETEARKDFVRQLTDKFPELSY